MLVMASLKPRMQADDVIKLLKTTSGLSDRQITDALFGPGMPPQPVNRVCRELEQRGLIFRQQGANGIIGNFLCDSNGPSSPIQRRTRDVTRFAVPAELSAKLHELGRLWAESSSRPRLTPEIKQHWDAVIEAWVEDSEMPLAVRKMGSGVRGAVVVHEASGREVILTDNSPAQWAFHCALQNQLYSLEELRQQLKNHKIPFAFATKSSEKLEMKYTATLSSCAVDLNSRGWKLCHIDPVGLRERMPIQQLSLEQLKNHFRLLLKPSNHFVVPKHWSGLGEIPEVIDEIRTFEHPRENSSSLRSAAL